MPFLIFQQPAKKETLFGKTYTTKMFTQVDKELGFDCIGYTTAKSYYLNGKYCFTTPISSVKYPDKDSVYMVTKRRILKDKLIVTEIYKKGIDAWCDSSIITYHFKNGVYLKWNHQDYHRDLSHIPRPKASDLRKVD